MSSSCVSPLRLSRTRRRRIPCRIHDLAVTFASSIPDIGRRRCGKTYYPTGISLYESTLTSPPLARVTARASGLRETDLTSDGVPPIIAVDTVGEGMKAIPERYRVVKTHTPWSSVDRTPRQPNGCRGTDSPPCLPATRSPAPRDFRRPTKSSRIVADNAYYAESPGGVRRNNPIQENASSDSRFPGNPGGL